MKTRYSPLNQAMHWITAACMFAILPLAWVMINAKPGSAIQHGTYNWHKTLGLIVLAITLFRIVWRFFDKPPAYPDRVAKWNQHLAHLAYALFFALMVWMPVTGFMESAYDGYPIKLFDLIQTPEIFPKNDPVANFWAMLHWYGEFGIYALIVLHVLAVVFHVTWRKDGTLDRMLPSQTLDAE